MASGPRSAKSPFAFGPFVLDAERRTLSRRGEFVALGARAMDVLGVLLAARGELVSKDELMARVWPGSAVDENNLHVQISALRKVLGEHTGGTRYVLTVPGRGYRFAIERAGRAMSVAPAIGGEETGGTMPQPRGEGVFLSPDRPSIAVLPFVDMTRDPQRDSFVEGIVEGVIAVLSRRRWLKVIARHSSFAYKGRAIDIRQVSRELGARYLLDGSVRTMGERLRVSAELIEPSTGAQLWTDRFDAPLADAFDVADQLSAGVAGAVALQVQRAEVDRARRKAVKHRDAYDHYLLGLACVHRQTRETSDEALRLFRKAIALEPEFAAAYAMAAWCYCQRKEDGWDRPSDVAEAGELAWRAVNLDRDDTVALSMSGRTLLYVTRELEAGAAFVDRALMLDPNLPMAWTGSGWARARMGEPAIAIEHVARAMQLSPFDPLMHNMQSAMAFAHFFAGRYDEAVSWSARVLNERPHSGHGLRVAAASHALAGRLLEARGMMERLRKVCPDMRLSNLDRQSPLRRAEDRARWAEGLGLAGLPE